MSSRDRGKTRIEKNQERENNALFSGHATPRKLAFKSMFRVSGYPRPAAASALPAEGGSRDCKMGKIAPCDGGSVLDRKKRGAV